MAVVKVEGQMVIRGEAGLPLVKYYDTEVSLDVDTEAEARIALHNGVLQQHLARYTDGFKRWRTCEITDFRRSEVKDSGLAKAIVEATTSGIAVPNVAVYADEESQAKAIKSVVSAEKKRRAEKKQREIENRKRAMGLSDDETQDEIVD